MRDLKGKTGKKSPAWKGNRVGYRGIHKWVEKELGKPMFCSNCDNKNEKMYHWANISKEYKRDINDWLRLCPYCHKRFDLYGQLPIWD